MEWFIKIKDLRVKAGLTQAELGRLVGRTESYISQLEKGRFGPPKPGTQDKFATAFGMTLQEFLVHLHTRDDGRGGITGVIQVPIAGVIENMIITQTTSTETVNVPESLVELFKNYRDHLIAFEIKDNIFINDGIKPDTFLIVFVTHDLIDGGTYIIKVGTTPIIRKIVKNSTGWVLSSPNGKYSVYDDKSVQIVGRVICAQSIKLFI